MAEVTPLAEGALTIGVGATGVVEVPAAHGVEAPRRAVAGAALVAVAVVAVARVETGKIYFGSNSFKASLKNSKKIPLISSSFCAYNKTDSSSLTLCLMRCERW